MDKEEIAIWIVISILIIGGLGCFYSMYKINQSIITRLEKISGWNETQIDNNQNLIQVCLNNSICTITELNKTQIAEMQGPYNEWGLTIIPFSAGIIMWMMAGAFILMELGFICD